ncbi:hypothetical protein [Jannaschia seohaensis]|uniref:Uncharacterized protein n=1 Tax=Jannaschia seohaensis TaxID=475081 RepID=A0A2Y9C8X5_9RHOB|nr:hypothetical protein [Jannaschia seohaensis]PWJ13287.1 hypothetical protein BCF38_11450 [Jannaschia seohaensis]SSA50613.1 hypothetical protein SAMN05421539_11450 [Jannaschia seohaensis]
MPLSNIRVEDEVFTAEGDVGLGAVREILPDHLWVSIEGYGDIRIDPEQIVAAHDGKVVLDVTKLPEHLQTLIAHVHDGEVQQPSEASEG